MPREPCDLELTNNNNATLFPDSSKLVNSSIWGGLCRSGGAESPNRLLIMTEDFSRATICLTCRCLANSAGRGQRFGPYARGWYFWKLTDKTKNVVVSKWDHSNNNWMPDIVRHCEFAPWNRRRKPAVCTRAPTSLLLRRTQETELAIDVDTRLQGAVLSIVPTQEPVFSVIFLAFASENSGSL